MKEDRTVSAEELLSLFESTQAELQAEMDDYDERAAIHEESIQASDNHKSTDQRAMEALERPEHFAGEHGVARAWLNKSTTSRLWRKSVPKDNP